MHNLSYLYELFYIASFFPILFDQNKYINFIVIVFSFFSFRFAFFCQSCLVYYDVNCLENLSKKIWIFVSSQHLKDANTIAFWPAKGRNQRHGKERWVIFNAFLIALTTVAYASPHSAMISNRKARIIYSSCICKLIIGIIRGLNTVYIVLYFLIGLDLKDGLSQTDITLIMQLMWLWRCFKQQSHNKTYSFPRKFLLKNGEQHGQCKFYTGMHAFSLKFFCVFFFLFCFSGNRNHMIGGGKTLIVAEFSYYG